MSVDDDLAIDSAVDGIRATVSLRGELDLATKAQLVDALTALVAGARTMLSSTWRACPSWTPWG